MLEAIFCTLISNQKMASIRFIAFVVLFGFLMHAAWSVFLVGVFRSVYSHRLIDLRKTANVGDEWEVLASSFVAETLGRAKKESKPVVMFVGSSVTYGLPWQERVIFTKTIAQQLPSWKIANLSVIGVGMQAITDFSTCALNEAHRPAIAFFEIPLVNSTASAKVGAPAVSRQCHDYSEGFPSYWSVVSLRPYGLGWIKILWPVEDYEKSDTEINVLQIPKNYFADSARFGIIENSYVSELRSYLSRVEKMGDKVFVYVSPIYTPSITEAGGDRAAVEYQIQLTNKICLEFQKVTCLDTSVFSSRRELFYNLTHLNQRGHRALADWFTQYIVPQGAASVQSTPLLPTN